MPDSKAQNMMMLELKFIQNLATSDVNNNSLERVVFDPKEMLGIFDLRLIGYHKIKQRILQQNLSRYYRLELEDILCEQFNIFVNTLKKEKEETMEKYSWLEPGDEKRNMLDREILDKYIDLDKILSTGYEKEAGYGYVIY